MESLKILQVVGYKNSGKTTLIESWIKTLANEQIDAAVIKHHGHQNGLELPNDQTDSMKFTTAGAVTSIAVDDHMIQLHQRKKEWSLTKLITLAKLSDPSILFIEGYKIESYPKVVIVKKEEDWTTLQTLTNIVCVVVHPKVNVPNIHTYPIQNTSQLNNWLNKWMGGE
ncbi:molybdopterin-guanine dinucleotide biosynthesis protein B [Psychrobacillus sp.]|uniref:molybdopterin-guanine dinucleotide biosynthesis protein B n=1 Tax=Psychrobacillus sp. TaxID=1871623 RepID=UPI0028BDFF22|nr:molybdopterin-guanine dinucleotide biosynthesis protein B [Psychrobacillus sp.]